MDAPVTARRGVRRGRLDLAHQVVVLGSGASWSRYTSVGLAEPVRGYLTMLGLKTALLAMPDANVAYDALKAGTIPDQRPEPKPRRSKARDALAAALALAAAGAGAPKGTKRAAIEADAKTRLAAMHAHVLTLSQETVRKLAGREDVREQYRRMHGGKPEDQQMSLLALAGLVDPLLDLPGDTGLPPETVQRESASP